MYVGADCESGLIKPGLQAPPWACGTFAYPEGEPLIEVTPAGYEKRLGDMLEDDGVDLVYAYGAFDLGLTYEHFPDLRPLIWRKYDRGQILDVQLREKLLDMATDRRNGSYSLAACVLRVFGTDISESKAGPDVWRLRYRELIGVPLELWPQAAIDYALTDATWALLLAERQRQRAGELDYLERDADGRLTPYIPGERARSRTSFALALISARGVRTDAERVRLWEADLDAQLTVTRSALLGDTEALARSLEHTEDPVLRGQIERWIQAIQREVEGGAFEPLARWKTVKGERTLSTSRKAVQARVIRGTVDQALADLREEHGAAVQAFEETTTEEHGGKDREVLRVYAGIPGSPLPAGTVEVSQHLNPLSGHVESSVREGAEMVSLGEIPLPRTETMAIKTAEEVCDAVADPLLEAYVRYKKAEKLHSTYLPALLAGAEAPVCARYDPLKSTLRTGCSNPNFQNLPQSGPARPCVRARPGHVLSTIDLDGAELRGWAELCYHMFGHSTMGDALNQGRDPHTILANRFPEYQGLSYDDLVKLKKAGDPNLKRRRDLAKIPNFSRMGGGGAARVREEVRKKQGLDLSLAEVKTLFNYFEETWSEAAEWFRWGSDQTLFGQQATIVHHLSGVRVAGLVYTQTLNNMFQGLVAQAFTDALYACVRACMLATPDDVLYGTRIVIEVHDEIIAEHPIGLADRAAAELCRVFLEAAQRWFTRVTLTASPALMTHWYKAADGVTDPSTGRLAVWLPCWPAPGDIPPGCELFDVNTGQTLVWDAGAWDYLWVPGQAFTGARAAIRLP